MASAKIGKNKDGRKISLMSRASLEKVLNTARPRDAQLIRNELVKRSK